MSIKAASTNKALSSLGGLFLYDSIYSKLAIDKTIESSLPSDKIKVRSNSLNKFKAMVFGFIAGADCLDDMDSFRGDPAFESVLDDINASNTYGDYLRKFTKSNCREMNKKLIETSLKLRKASHPDDNQFILDLDSTPHLQSGKKMEGTEYNYKSDFCLDSLQAFDQYGYQYWMNVREGSTYTSVGAEEVIYEVFRQVPQKLSSRIPVKRIVRADSGFCNFGVFEAASKNNAKFVICMRANMYEPLLKNIKHWAKAKKIRMKGNRECEIGHTLYYPKNSKQPYRVVMIRSLKEGTNRPLFSEDAYDYQGWVTSIGVHEKQDEKLVLLYRGRGNAENFIKELKGGFDLRHFPCQSLVANKAYALMGAFAYILMRYTGFILNRKKPSFSKKIRLRMVFLAVEVVKKARDVLFRFYKHTTREVLSWQTTAIKQLGSG